MASWARTQKCHGASLWHRILSLLLLVNHPGAEFQYQEPNPSQSLRRCQDKAIQRNGESERPLFLLGGRSSSQPWGSALLRVTSPYSLRNRSHAEEPEAGGAGLLGGQWGAPRARLAAEPSTHGMGTQLRRNPGTFLRTTWLPSVSAAPRNPRSPAAGAPEGIAWLCLSHSPSCHLVLFAFRS